MLTTPFHNLKFAEKHWTTTKPNEDKNNTWAYFSTFAKTHSGPASAAVPDLLSSKSPSMHRSHPWSHAWPPCFLEEWRCSWRSHFGSSNCSTSRRPAPTAPPEGGSLNGPWRQMMFYQNWPSCVTKLDYWESQKWQHIKMHWPNLGFLHWCPPQANLVASGTPYGVKDMMSSTESKKPEFRGATPSQSYFQNTNPILQPMRCIESSCMMVSRILCLLGIWWNLVTLRCCKSPTLNMKKLSEPRCYLHKCFPPEQTWYPSWIPSLNAHRSSTLICFTLPETNSSPLKIRRAPKGNNRIPTVHFRVLC